MLSSRLEGLSLRLANGSRWVVSPADGYADRVIDCLASAAALKEATDEGSMHITLSTSNEAWEKLAAAPMMGSLRFHHLPLRGNDGKEQIFCAVNPEFRCDDLVSSHAMQLIHLVTSFEVNRGASLLHSGLAELGGAGVVLPGKSKAGKSTASRRIGKPWNSLCDDMVLVLPDEKGNYYAHPLPTWSRVRGADTVERWSVEQAVPLKAAFFLEQSRVDCADPLGPGKSLCLLNEVCNQVTWLIDQHHREGQKRAFRLRLFNNLSALAAAVPGYRLRNTLDGAFWKEMERALDLQEALCTP